MDPTYPARERSQPTSRRGTTLMRRGAPLAALGAITLTAVALWSAPAQAATQTSQSKAASRPQTSVPTCATGYVAAVNASNQSALGYVVGSPTYGDFYGEFEPDTSTPSDLLKVTVPTASTGSLLIQPSSGNPSAIDLAAGFDGSTLTNANGGGYGYFSPGTPTAVGAAPAPTSSAWEGDGDAESAVWTLGQDDSLTATWINPDTSTVPLTILLDEEPFIGFAASLTSFTSYYGPATPLDLSLDVLSTGPCPVASTTTLSADSSSGSVSGQSVTLTATISGDNGVNPPTGTVDFTAGGASIGCDSQSVSTTAGVTTATCTTSSLPVGSEDLAASYSGDGPYLSSTAQDLTYPVDQASTQTEVSASSAGLIATVTAVAPGVGTPTGDVTFLVDGKSVGDQALGNGAATLAHPVSAGHTVTANYGGDTDFAASSADTSTGSPTDPVIKAHLSSTGELSKAGWYDANVTASFTCHKGSAPLASACPSPVTLTHSTRDGSVSRTIRGTDGAKATIDITAIKIDKSSPKVAIKGVKRGSEYRGAGPKAQCVATDTWSGVANCKLSIARHGLTVRYTATATDKAGNISTTHKAVTVAPDYVKGAKIRHGKFVLHLGKHYTVVAYSTSAKAPRYLVAAPSSQVPTTPGYAMTKAGHHLWTIRIHIRPAMIVHTTWSFGVRSGGTTDLVPFTVVK